MPLLCQLTMLWPQCPWILSPVTQSLSACFPSDWWWWNEIMPNMLKQSFVWFQLPVDQTVPHSSSPGKPLNYSNPLGSFPVPLFLPQFKDKDVYRSKCHRAFAEAKCRLLKVNNAFSQISWLLFHNKVGQPQMLWKYHQTMQLQSSCSVLELPKLRRSQ